MTFLKKYRTEIIGAIAGMAGGFLYWKYVGCISGTCPIQSNPVISTLYGTFLGVFAAGILKDIVQKIKKPVKEASK